jgi:hypothetical protein
MKRLVNLGLKIKTKDQFEIFDEFNLRLFFLSDVFIQSLVLLRFKLKKPTPTDLCKSKLFIRRLCT